MGRIAPRIPTGNAMCHTSPVLCAEGFSANSMVSGESPSPCLYCTNNVTFAALELCSAKLTHPGPVVGPNSTARDAPSGSGEPGAAPERLELITGWGKSRKVTGDGDVRGRIEAVLREMGATLLPTANPGRLAVDPERWLRSPES